jgi:hypothetical protein
MDGGDVIKPNRHGPVWCLPPKTKFRTFQGWGLQPGWNFNFVPTLGGNFSVLPGIAGPAPEFGHNLVMRLESCAGKSGHAC